MKNIDISLVNFLSHGINRLSFKQDEHTDLWITSIDSENGTQHDYSLTKEDWEFLKTHIDKLFKR